MEKLVTNIPNRFRQREKFVSTSCSLRFGVFYLEGRKRKLDYKEEVIIHCDSDRRSVQLNGFTSQQPETTLKVHDYELKL
jgi:hypothetical protein